MIDDTTTPPEAAAAIAAARDRLIAFAQACPQDAWRVCVLMENGDVRPAGVVVDHVGHAYEYLAGFIGTVVAGEAPHIDSELIDSLNAEHAAAASDVTVTGAVSRLRVSGDALCALIRSLTPQQLALADGRVRRLAAIAERHADGHRTELEEAMAAGGGAGPQDRPVAGREAQVT